MNLFNAQEKFISRAMRHYISFIRNFVRILDYKIHQDFKTCCNAQTIMQDVKIKQLVFGGLMKENSVIPFLVCST